MNRPNDLPLPTKRLPGFATLTLQLSDEAWALTLPVIEQQSRGILGDQVGNIVGVICERKTVSVLLVAASNLKHCPIEDLQKGSLQFTRAAHFPAERQSDITAS